MKSFGALAVAVVVVLVAPLPAAAGGKLERIVVSDDGTHFLAKPSGGKFVAWGFNYTHNRAGELIEDFWADDWATLAGDFREMKALACYEVGKPIVIEETFTLKCGVKDFNAFVDGSRKIADGWIGHYFGRTIADYEKATPTLADAIHKAFLVYFKKKTAEILPPTKP